MLTELDPNSGGEHITGVLLFQSHAPRCAKGVYQVFVDSRLQETHPGEMQHQGEFTHRGNGGIAKRKPRRCERFKGAILKNLAVLGVD